MDRRKRRSASLAELPSKRQTRSSFNALRNQPVVLVERMQLDSSSNIDSIATEEEGSVIEKDTTNEANETDETESVENEKDTTNEANDTDDTESVENEKDTTNEENERDDTESVENEKDTTNEANDTDDTESVESAAVESASVECASIESVSLGNAAVESTSVENDPTQQVLDTVETSFVGQPRQAVNYRFTDGKKKGTQVLYSIDEKQKYKVNKRNQGELNEKRDEYTCCQSHCPARIWLYGSGVCIFSPNHKQHNHASDAEKIVERDAVVGKSKRDASTLQLQNGRLPTLEEIFRNNATEANVSGLVYKKHSRSIQKARQSAYPRSPSNVGEINDIFRNNEHVRNTFGLTKRIDESTKTNLFKGAIEGEDYAACIFASDDIVQSILSTSTSDNRLLYADATFKITPIGIFKQVLVLFADIYTHVVPFAWLLMSNKKQGTYKAVLEYVDKNVLPLKCVSFMSDYELALRNGFADVVPEATLTACWFHFVQAVKRNMMKMPGLVKLIRTNTDAGIIYYKLQSLPLLPSVHITPAFNMLKSEAFGLDKKLFAPFFTYYEHQWLKREGPEKISVFNLMHRTTCSVEAYNKVIGEIIPTKSNLFIFAAKLQLHEEKKAYDANLLAESGGESGQAAKLKTQMRNKAIDTAMDLIKSNKIDFNAFLKRVIFDNKKVRDGMMTFESVDPLDPADMYDQIDFEDEADEISNNRELSSVRLCVICKNASPVVTLLPCRHQCLCIDCYQKWNRVDKSLLDVLPHVGDYNDVNIFAGDSQNAHEPNADTVCPVCKVPVKDYIESILS